MEEGSTQAGRQDSILEVAAGLVFRKGHLLIAQRRDHDHQGGLWEFPGGKRQEGESLPDCLRRELREELGIEVEVLDLLDTIAHAYPDRTVALSFYRCRWLRHEPQAIGCQDWAWVTRRELARYAFPPADEHLLERLATDSSLWQLGWGFEGR